MVCVFGTILSSKTVLCMVRDVFLMVLFYAVPLLISLIYLKNVQATLEQKGSLIPILVCAMVVIAAAVGFFGVNAQC